MYCILFGFRSKVVHPDCSGGIMVRIVGKGKGNLEAKREKRLDRWIPDYDIRGRAGSRFYLIVGTALSIIDWSRLTS